LSAVFTSDKLLLTVLVRVLHSNIEKVASLDRCSVDAVQTSERCCIANKHGLNKAERQLWRQKSATMPVKRNCVSCGSRRLSEPLMTSAEQMQTCRISPDAKIFHVDRTPSDVQPDVDTSKPSGSGSNPVWLSSTAPTHSCVVSTTTCSSIDPLVVNPVYGSDDCSTLKSLSFEKKDSRLQQYTSALKQVLDGSQDIVSDFVSDPCTSLSSADEERCRTTPVISECVAEENITFPEVRTGECDVAVSSYAYADVSCQGSESNDEARNVCAQFGYRKVCVYLQEGTWRHSPHSLHCIRIDDDISLVVLCEVILL